MYASLGDVLQIAAKVCRCGLIFAAIVVVTVVTVVVIIIVVFVAVAACKPKNARSPTTHARTDA